MVMNILRGRDHGLPDYNMARESLGLRRKTSFQEIAYFDPFRSDIDPSVSITSLMSPSSFKDIETFL